MQRWLVQRLWNHLLQYGPTDLWQPWASLGRIVIPFDHRHRPFFLSCFLHSVPGWLVQRRAGDLLHALPVQQHQRCQLGDMCLQRWLLWHWLRRHPRVHR